MLPRSAQTHGNCPSAARSTLGPKRPSGSRSSRSTPTPQYHGTPALGARCLRGRSRAVGLRPAAAGGPRAASSARCGRRVVALPCAKDARCGTALGSAAASLSARGHRTAQPGSGPGQRSAAELAAGRGQRDLAAGRPAAQCGSPRGSQSRLLSAHRGNAAGPPPALLLSPIRPAVTSGLGDDPFCCGPPVAPRALAAASSARLPAAQQVEGWLRAGAD